MWFVFVKYFLFELCIIMFIAGINRWSFIAIRWLLSNFLPISWGWPNRRGVSNRSYLVRVKGKIRHGRVLCCVCMHSAILTSDNLCVNIKSIGWDCDELLRLDCQFIFNFVPDCLSFRWFQICLPVEHRLWSSHLLHRSSGQEGVEHDVQGAPRARRSHRQLRIFWPPLEDCPRNSTIRRSSSSSSWWALRRTWVVPLEPNCFWVNCRHASEIERHLNVMLTKIQSINELLWHRYHNAQGIGCWRTKSNRN